MYSEQYKKKKRRHLEDDPTNVPGCSHSSVDIFNENPRKLNEINYMTSPTAASTSKNLKGDSMLPASSNEESYNRGTTAPDSGPCNSKSDASFSLTDQEKAESVSLTSKMYSNQCKKVKRKHLEDDPTYVPECSHSSIGTFHENPMKLNEIYYMSEPTAASISKKLKGNSMLPASSNKESYDRDNQPDTSLVDKLKENFTEASNIDRVPFKDRNFTSLPPKEKIIEGVTGNPKYFHFLHTCKKHHGLVYIMKSNKFGEAKKFIIEDKALDVSDSERPPHVAHTSHDVPPPQTRIKKKVSSKDVLNCKDKISSAFVSNTNVRNLNEADIFNNDIENQCMVADKESSGMEIDSVDKTSAMISNTDARNLNEADIFNNDFENQFIVAGKEPSELEMHSVDFEMFLEQEEPVGMKFVPRPIDRDDLPIKIVPELRVSDAHDITTCVEKLPCDTSYQLPLILMLIQESDVAVNHKEFRKMVRHLPVFRPAFMTVIDLLKDLDSENIFFPTVLTFQKSSLSSIRKNLKCFKYHDAWEVIEAIQSVFNDALFKNGENSRIGKVTIKLSNHFRKMSQNIMSHLGYCCSEIRAFGPYPIICIASTNCIIQKDMMYYSLSDKFNICNNCYQNLYSKGDTFVLEAGVNFQEVKDQFVSTFNRKTEKEPFTRCERCSKKFHVVCVGAVCGKFLCSRCSEHCVSENKNLKYVARNLKISHVAQHIENRVNNFLLDKACNSENITIRLLSCSKKYAEVKEFMRARYAIKADYPGNFPYRSKIILAFQQNFNKDVAFFGFLAQEYDSECPMPNTRCVYIRYLDSVPFFEPKEYRTDVYHEIILGYLEYVKLLGFKTAYLWSCPPGAGIDYLFLGHPPEQKIPSSERLGLWCKRLLNKGSRYNIVTKYRSLYVEAVESNWTSVTNVPYFDGDYWPEFFERSIKMICGGNKDLASVTEPAQSTGSENKICKRRKRRSNGSTNRKSLPKHLSPMDKLTEEFYSKLKILKNEFFCVVLNSSNISRVVPKIEDPDDLISCPMMESRESFLEFCRKNHLEFSSLWRAKYSTLYLLYTLLFERCNNFDLETPCYHRDCEEREKQRKRVSDVYLTNIPSTTDGLYHIKVNQRYLLHTCLCTNKYCELPPCRNLKPVVTEMRAKVEENKLNPYETRCIRTHANKCVRVMCPVPGCKKFKG